LEDLDGSRALELPAAASLPDFAELEGNGSWAQVRIGWNSRGIAFVIRAQGVSDEQLEVGRPDGFAEAHFWIDTRDTRDVSRATRFCHHFVINLVKKAPRGGLTAAVAQRPIARATADAPIYRGDRVSAVADLAKGNWALSLFLPAEALYGYDPDNNRRLGFAYQISDRIRPDQFLGVGREFPLGENPSLWATLELCG
jgi:hypothetical protein